MELLASRHENKDMVKVMCDDLPSAEQLVAYFLAGIFAIFALLSIAVYTYTRPPRQTDSVDPLDDTDEIDRSDYRDQHL